MSLVESSTFAEAVNVNEHKISLSLRLISAENELMYLYAAFFTACRLVTRASKRINICLGLFSLSGIGILSVASRFTSWQKTTAQIGESHAIDATHVIHVTHVEHTALPMMTYAA